MAVLTRGAEDPVTGFGTVVVVLERGPRVRVNVVDIDVATETGSRRIDGVDAVADEVGDRADGVGGREIGKALPVARCGGVPPEVAEVTRVVVRPTVEAHADVHVFTRHLCHGVHAGLEWRLAEVAPCVGRGVVAPKAVAAGTRGVSSAEDVGFTCIRKGSRRGAGRRHVRTARDRHLDVGGAVAGGEGKERQEEYVGLCFYMLSGFEGCGDMSLITADERAPHFAHGAHWDPAKRPRPRRGFCISVAGLSGVCRGSSVNLHGSFS